MDYSRLLGEVLDDRGYAILVIGHPALGEQATIQAVNGCFAEMLGSQAELLTGLRLSAFRSRLEHSTDWAMLIASVRGLTPLKLDIKLRLDDREIWFGFDLTYKIDARDGASYGFMIGRDITSARRQSIENNEAQRLLASVFVRTSAPVLLVRASGTILMANPAFHQLLGYSPEETTTLNVSTLTPPEHTKVLTAARALQLQDGKTYELTLETLAKNGTRVSVRLTSVLLRDTQDVRVVTLLPFVPIPAQPVASASPGIAAMAQSRSIGQMQTLSIAAFKTAFGALWERRASRAMMLAEQIIKQRLAPADVLSRSDDQSFIVWFDSQDEDRNAAVLDKAARAIRLRLLAEFGGDAAAHIHAVVLQVAAATYPADIAGSPGQLRSSPALKDSLLEK